MVPLTQFVRALRGCYVDKCELRGDQLLLRAAVAPPAVPAAFLGDREKEDGVATRGSVVHRRREDLLVQLPTTELRHTSARCTRTTRHGCDGTAVMARLMALCVMMPGGAARTSYMPTTCL